MTEERRATKDDDELYHFISYVPVNGKLYELDGLKPGPICLGETGEGDAWLSAVTPAIQARIEQYSSREIRFNLLAVTADRRDRLLAEQAVIEKERNMTVGKVQARSGKLPSPAELERLAAAHPAPPSMGEVAVDERTIEELMIALAHLTARAAKVRAGQALGRWGSTPQAALKRLGATWLVTALSHNLERPPLVPSWSCGRRRADQLLASPFQRPPWLTTPPALLVTSRLLEPSWPHLR